VCGGQRMPLKVSKEQVNQIIQLRAAATAAAAALRKAAQTPDLQLENARLQQKIADLERTQAQPPPADAPQQSLISPPGGGSSSLAGLDDDDDETADLFRLGEAEFDDDEDEDDFMESL